MAGGQLNQMIVEALSSLNDSIGVQKMNPKQIVSVLMPKVFGMSLCTDTVIVNNICMLSLLRKKTLSL